MKTAYIFGIALIFITLIFVFASANFNQPAVSARSLSAASLSMQTATPITDGTSEVGSTDGIVIMGITLVIIVILPLLFHKRKK